jgi:uncharacterized protein (DUF302 family)
VDPKGIIIRPSKYSVKETIDRLQQFLRQHDVTIYARIDQQKEVNNTGQNIPPLEFMLFGNPKAGGPVMAENPIAALDLPLKVVAWEDRDKQVWLGYNDRSYISERYHLSGDISSPLDIDPPDRENTLIPSASARIAPQLNFAVKKSIVRFQASSAAALS